jgi:alkanesulfonate monooxygenase SsuD/methylene tetrahydromethanopterin reductase-like flavin-dependent oxidoreductase (luciferase family)
VAGRHADGWNTVWTWTHQAWAERSSALDQACERAGRDPASVSRSVGLYALAGEDEADLARRFRRLARLSPGVLDGVSLDQWRRGRLVGTVDQVAGQLDRWRELGVGTLIVSAGAVPFSVAAPDDVVLLAAACSL